MNETGDGVAVNGQGQAGGRGPGGQFGAGNKVGPGNPFARKTAEMRQAIQDAVTAEDLADVARVIRVLALGGNLAAARLIFSYSAGKPAQGADPDTLDAHELEVRRGATATEEDMRALFERCPAWLVNVIGGAVSAGVQKHMAGAMGEGLKRQVEMEKGSGASGAAGSLPGFKADWVPDWLKEGKLPEGLSKVFEACPAWAPDYLGGQGPGAYGEMVRGVRSDGGRRTAATFPTTTMSAESSRSWTSRFFSMDETPLSTS